MAAEWITAAQVIAASAIAYLGGRRSSQATEKTAQTNAETQSLSYVFSELKDVREQARKTEEALRGQIQSLSTKCDELVAKAEKLQARVYVLEQEKQTASLEHQNELAHRDREVEKLQEIVHDKEARLRRYETSQQDLIRFIQTHYHCEEDTLLIGTVEICFKDKFTQRSLQQAQAQRQERQEKERQEDDP